MSDPTASARPADHASTPATLHEVRADARSTPPDAEEAPRPVVAGFRVGRLLGRGGTSAVWLVTDDDGRSFALKVAVAPRTATPTQAFPTSALVAGRRGRRAAGPPDGGSPPRAGGQRSSDGADGPYGLSGPHGPSDRTADDISRELLTLQRFRHDHLLRVLRIVGTDAGPGLLMDLAPGGSLLNLVTSRGPLPIAEVVTALVPIAQVLAHLHGAGALHGDVSPGNILFTQEGKPLLGDFGTARLLGADPVPGAGTPGFIDPLRDGSFDTGADVFALAAVSWFALTGRVPGPAEHRPPLALIIPDVPPQLMELIEDGLDPSRARRPTADSFARVLLSSTEPGPVDLVPAVHPSVLPHLLTRRTGTAPSGLTRRWKRVAGGRGRDRDRKDGRPRPRGATAGRRTPGVPAVGRGGVRPGPGRIRTLLAIVSGVAALVLLLGGIALTLGGPDAPGGDRPGAATSGISIVPAPESATGEGSVVDGGRSGGAAQEETRQEETRQEGGGQERAGDERAGQDDAAQGGAGQEQAAPRPPSPQAPAGVTLDADPVTALVGLAALRAEAFATADPSLLATVDVQGSPAMSADQEAVTALAASGRSLRDLSITIRDPAALGGEEQAAMTAVAGLPASAPPAGTEVSLVRATAAVSSYTEAAGPAGHSADAPRPLMAAGLQDLIFVLWDSGGGWRIHSVVSPG
ncbi:hypothetical protein CVO76_04775 [Arthrobacter agilis]|uniref:non-specific serine/threonine protein kinase n=1 Tax=Arthrobacter agilis TaxID=37921 RepID=A0A2L0UCP6_9MICC|nr:serine/threonine-protein kinase [Arthrobacter agilis]AUZ87021.1 hypothetical protein CVO76_04775 [Arthrobacter agilis]